MPDTVHCKDCGFLAILQRIPLRTLVEADREIRKFGRQPAPRTDILEFEPAPICFVRQNQLPDEFAAATERFKSEWGKAFLEVIGTDRAENCKGAFTEWNQGFSPKEHYEMLQEKDRLAWQATRDEEAREFQRKQAAESRWHNWLTLVVAVGGLLVAVWKSKEPTVIELKQPAATATALPSPAATAPATPATTPLTAPAKPAPTATAPTTPAKPAP